MGDRGRGGCRGSRGGGGGRGGNVTDKKPHNPTRTFKGEATVTCKNPNTGSSNVQGLSGVTIKVGKLSLAGKATKEDGRGGRGGGGGIGRGAVPPAHNSAPDWVCRNPKCGNINYAWRKACNMCNEEKYGSHANGPPGPGRVVYGVGRGAHSGGDRKPTTAGGASNSSKQAGGSGRGRQGPSKQQNVTIVVNLPKM